MKFLKVVLLAMLFMGAITANVSADHKEGHKDKGNGHTPITICHFNNGQGGRWNKQTVDAESIVKNGHQTHHDSQDIIPEFIYQDRVYPAQGDQSILNNGCIDPAPPVTPIETPVTPEVTPITPVVTPVEAPETPVVPEVPQATPVIPPVENPTEESPIPTVVPIVTPDATAPPAEIPVDSSVPNVVTLNNDSNTESSPVVTALPETGTGFAENKTYAIVSILVGGIIGGIVTYRMTED